MITTIKEKYHHVNAIFYEKKKTIYIVITFFHKITKQILKAPNTEITQK